MMKFILIADKETPPVSFFPIWEVIIFVLIITAVLLALFPRHMLNKILAYNQASMVSVSYLESFKKHDPQNIPLLMTLSKQEAELGKINQAEINLVFLKKINRVTNPEMSTQLHWIDYQILKAKTTQALKNQLKYKELSKQLHATAKILATEPLTIEQLKTLANDNLAYNQATVSVKIYQHLMNENKLLTTADFALAGNLAFQSNAHRVSANFYKAAYNKVLTINDKRQYAREVIKVLWAASYLQEALDYATKLPEAVIDNPEMLLYISELAIAANHPDIAQKYALKALFYGHKINHE